MPPKSVELQFPLKGLNEGWAYGKQPPGTSPQVLNVRPHDNLLQRARGGSRPGCVKYLTAAVNGVNAIQALGSGVLTIDPGEIVPSTPLLGDDADNYNDGDELQVVSATWDEHQITSAAWRNIADGAGYSKIDTISGQKFIQFKTFPAGAGVGVLLRRTPDLVLTDMYVVEATILPPNKTGATTTEFGILLRLDTTNLDADVATATGIKIAFTNATEDGSGNYTTRFHYRVNNTASVSGTLFGSTFVLNSNVPVKMAVHVSGNTFSAYINDAFMGSLTSSSYSTQKGIGFAWLPTTPGSVKAAQAGIGSLAVSTGMVPASLREVKLVAVSGGSVYVGNKADGLALATAGTSVVKATGRIGWQDTSQSMYFCDGLNSGYKVLDLRTNAISTWAATSGAVPVGTVDSGRACSIITRYRGRIVLAGLQEEPQNWFMSAVGDPLNWNYAPTVTTQTQAVAGNNSDAGEIGDVITAMVPYSDDTLLFGGDHTIWLLRGDPAAGGIIDAVSYQTGIVGPDAWTFDPNGNLYFFGNVGLFRMEAGGMKPPELLSSGRLDYTFRDVDLGEKSVLLLWDRRRQGCHIFLTPATQGATYHYYWDQRTDSFWKEQYPNASGPTAVHTFDADEADDRAGLMGGFDSYIRYLLDTATDDDTTSSTSAIESLVMFTPIFGDQAHDILLSDLVFTLGASTNASMEWRLRVAKATYLLVGGAVVAAAGPAKAGLNRARRHRLTGAAMSFELTNTSLAGVAWYGVENVRATITPLASRTTGGV